MRICLLLWSQQKDDTYEKIISNIQEIKARKGNVIAIVTEGDERISKNG